jgi:hypothetical protein
MRALIPSPTGWLRLSLLAASGLVFASVVVSVGVQILRPGEQPRPAARSFFLMDERSFRKAIQAERLSEDPAIELGVKPAQPAEEEPLVETTEQVH